MFKNIRKNCLTFLSLCLLYALSPLALADDYKCHVKLENGENKILFVQTDSELKAVIEAKHRYIPISGKKINVVKVHECKSKSESFSSAAANELYASTPQ